MLLSIKGAAQAPPNWNEIDLKLINFNNHPISKIHKWLLLFLFLLLMLLLGIFGNIFLHLIDYQSLGTGSCIRSQENFKSGFWSIIFSCNLKHFWPQKLFMLIPHFWDISNMVRLRCAYVILELLWLLLQ